MDTKPSPREFSQEEKEFMMTLDEKQRRRYAASLAIAFGCHGVRKVSDFFGINQKTVESQVVFREKLPKWNYLIKPA